MFCPQCKYTSFDHLPKCPKCSYDWMEQRKQLNLGWLEEPEEPSREEHSPSFELEDEGRASHGAAQAGGELSASAFSSSPSRSAQKGGPDDDSLLAEETGSEGQERAATRRSAFDASRDPAENEVSEDAQEISFPELDDLFSSPEGQAEPASEEDEAADDIEPVLDFEPDSQEEGPSPERPSSAAGESEDDASQGELELDISSFIDDLEIEPEDSEGSERKGSGS